MSIIISAAHGLHSNHPGHDARCELRTQINAHPRGSSSNGYGCNVTGGHCVPGEYCENRRTEAHNQDLAREDMGPFEQMLEMAMIARGIPSFAKSAKKEKPAGKRQPQTRNYQ